MLKLLTGYDQRAPRRLKPVLYSRQPAVTWEMEYEIAPGKVGLSARALLASCGHSRHATHWPQSRLHAQDSSEMLLAYVFSLFLFTPLPLPSEDAVGLQYTTPGKRDKFL